MIKRTLAVALLSMIIAFGSFGQDATGESVLNLDALNTDLSTLFTSIGQDLLPSLHRLSWSGFDTVGEARLHGFGFYVTPLAASLSVVDGAAKVLSSDDVWNFTLVSIPSIIDDAAGSDQQVQEIMDLATANAFPLPTLRLGLGFRLPGKLEFLANGFYIPPTLVDQGLGLLGGSAGDIDLDALAPTLEMLSVGGMVRKVILSEKHHFFRPSLSFGVGYSYSSFVLGADGFSLDAFGVVVDDESTGGLGTLTMSGLVGFKNVTQTIGATLALSKRFLLLFTPFAKASAYYYVSDYESDFQVTATLTPSDGSTPIVQSLDAPVRLHAEGVALSVASGLEMVVLPLTLTVGVNLDLDRPVVDIRDFTLDGFTLNGVTAVIAARVHI